MALESTKNLMDPREEDNDQELEIGLRPQSWDDFIGQDKVKKNLLVYSRAAKKRDESLDHVLIYGPPGLGKTTLAGVLAKELGVDCRISSGPALARTGDLASILTNLKRGDIFFIDEIHRLSKIVEEVLYSAMEDFAIDIVLGKGPAAKTVRLNLEPFTLIGATTKAGSISAPLRDRFGVVERLNFYNQSDILKILKNAAEKMEIEYDDQALKLIAKASRGTPRVANRLLKRVRDFACVNEQSLTVELVNSSLLSLGIDHNGLNSFDRALLAIMINKFKGGPVGLDTLAAALSEDRETIEDYTEPYLLRLGLIEKTNRGRKATDQARAWAHEDGWQ